MYADDFYSDSPLIRMQSNAFGNFCDAVPFLRINIEITVEVLERKRSRARFGCAFACIFNFNEKTIESKVREGEDRPGLDRSGVLSVIRNIRIASIL